MALEQHAIPTQVTAYEFRLIGDMTLKQFGWLAAGILIAALFYASPLPSYIRWPLILLFAPMGALVAFVPYEGRGIDRWVVSFVKAIYAPTEYLWHQEKHMPEFFKQSTSKQNVAPIKMTQSDQTQLEEYIHTLPTVQTTSRLDQLETDQIEQLNQLIENQETSSPISSTNNQFADKITPESLLAQNEIYVSQNPIMSDTTQLPDMFESGPTIPLENFENLAQTNTLEPASIFDEPKVISMFPVEPVKREQVGVEEESLHQNELGTLDQLEQLQSVVQPIEPIAHGVEDQTVPEAINFTDSVLPISQDLQQSMGQKIPVPVQEVLMEKQTIPVTFTENLPITLPDGPNIIVGMVKDLQGKLVNSAIIEIKDQQGKPVRALKTNKLGQFAIATSLKNGSYIIELEKEGLNFDIFSFEAKGEIISPIEIKAK